jgi:DNA-binding transcriptional MerR regulator
VSVSVLRAWEARYGLFTPVRSPAGYRLYTAADETRARRMLGPLGSGLAARESASLVLAGADAGTALEALVAAWRAFDATEAQRQLDELLSAPDPETVISRVVLPALEELDLPAAHFARRILETRLLGLSAGWHEGSGPLALVGCGPGEPDGLAAITLALALHRRGWRIVYLGADTPVEAYAAAASALDAGLVVVWFGLEWTLARVHDEVRTLAGSCALALAGPATTHAGAASLAAAWLPSDAATAV